MDVKEPYFSIITPTYNRGYIIGDMIESLFVQKFPNWELIIVDDGSTDNTADIIDRYRKRSDKISYFRFEKNRGVNVARNFGSQQAKGRWLIFMDSDDRFTENALETIYKYTENVESVLFFFACQNSKGEIMSNSPNYEGFVSFKELLCGRLRGEYLPVVRAEVFVKFLFPEDIKGGEGFTWFLIAKAYRQIFISKHIVRLYNDKLIDRLSVRRRNLRRLAGVWRKHLICFWKDYIRFCPRSLFLIAGKLTAYYAASKLFGSDDRS